MISRDKLQAGSCYFLVTYQDCDASVPVVETLRFKSQVSENDSLAPLFVFERIGEVAQRQCRLSEDLLTRIFEFDALVSEFATRAGGRRAGTPYEPRYCDD